jgi:hypothetical protein
VYQKRALIRELIQWPAGSKGWTGKGLWLRSGCEKGSKPGAKRCIRHVCEVTYRDSRVLGREAWGKGNNSALNGIPQDGRPSRLGKGRDGLGSPSYLVSAWCRLKCDLAASSSSLWANALRLVSTIPRPKRSSLGA